MVLSPLSLLNEAYYLAQNPDVAAAVARGEFASGAAHFAAFGQFEQREFTPYFDADFYLQSNPDVAASGMGALAHFTAFGYAEGRAPFAEFVPATYLLLNPDVAAAGVNPLEHFYTFGIAENRQVTPSTPPTPPTPLPSSSPFSFAQYTTNLPSAFSGDEDTTIAITGARVAAPNEAHVASITLSVAHGTISVASNVAGGVTAAQITNNGTSSVTISNALWVQLNTTFADSSSIIYTPTANYNGTDTLTVATNDGVVTDTDTATITVNDTPDNPTNSVPAAQTFNEDTTKTFNTAGGNLISVSDPDDTSLTSYQISVSHGILTLSGTTGLTISSGANASSTMTFSGTIININAALDGLVYTPTANYNGTDTISIISNDGAFTDSDSIILNITAVNDPPINSVPAAQTFNEDTTRTFSVGNSNLISVSDADNSSLTSYQISVTHGILTLSGTTGLTISAGANASATMTFSGTITNINAALAGLIYTPTADYNGTDTISITSNDGVATDTDSIVLNITAVNDAPILAGVNATTAYVQNDSAAIIDSTITTPTDVDDTNMESATIAITAGGDFVGAGGIDSLNYSTLYGVTGAYDSNTGILTLTGSATKAEYELILESITFSSTSATSGNRTISYTINDGTDNSNTQTATITYGLAPTLIGLLTDQNTAANQAASAWTFDGSTAFGGAGNYSLTTTDQLGNTVTGFSINSSTGIITNTALIPNTTTAYIFTVTRTNGSTAVSETFDLFTNAGALTYTGTTGNDTVTTNTRIWGNDGDDSLGTNNNSTLHGGEGNDTIYSGGVGTRVYYGGAGDDIITGSSTTDTIYAGSGSDTITGGSGTDFISGGTGVDRFYYSGIADSTVAGRDTINDFSQSSGEKIYITNSFDKIHAGDGTSADTAISGISDGDLVWYQSAGNTFVYDPFAAVTTFSIQLTGLIALTNADFVFEGYAASVTGTAGADTIAANTWFYTYLGFAGNDSISGGAWSSTINGGEGNDTISLGGQTLFVRGGAGNDSITFSSNGSQTIHGGSGNDTISGSGGTNTIYGGSGSDSITGAGGADSLYGGEGADYFVYTGTDSTAAGRDTIFDFSQSDGDKIYLKNGFDKIITGGTGTAATDSVLGGFEVGNLVTYQSGGNTFIYDPVAANSTFSIQLTGLITLTSADFVFEGSAASLTGTAGADTITDSTSSTAVVGLAGNDSITVPGGVVTPTINGGDGNDTITSLSTFIAYGGAGNDSVSGSGGADKLYGGSGGDTITGGTGADSIFAGSSDAAIDRIVYSATTDGASAGANTGFDTISEFEVGTDKIAFTSTVNTSFDDIGANNDTFAWVSNAPANFTTTDEGLFRSGFADADLTQASFTTLLANLNALGITAASTNDGIIIAQGATQTAFYLYTENGTLANNIVSAELTLLGVTNGQLTTSDFIFA